LWEKVPEGRMGGRAVGRDAGERVRGR
jgi:hypothetical protein